MHRSSRACGGESAKEPIPNKKWEIPIAASIAGVLLCIYRNIGRRMGQSKMARTAHMPRHGDGKIESEAISRSGGPGLAFTSRAAPENAQGLFAWEITR